MLENAAENVRRYAPPSQRNRALGRRKSGDRFEKINYVSGHDREKNQSHSRNFVSIDHGDLINSKYQSESHSSVIPVDGCCNSEAAQLLSERWAAAMQSCNDPAVDLSADRPVIYAGAGGLAWGQLKLPHQMDFLAELRRVYHSSPSATPTPSGGR